MAGDVNIEIHDPSGYRYAITSKNFETIGRWVVETYAEMSQNGWDLYKYAPRVMVYPSWNPETREADWVQDTRILSRGFTASTPEQFLNGMRLQIEGYPHDPASD